MGMSKNVLVEEDSFKIEFEDFDGLVFLHAVVYEESKSALKDLKHTFQVICDEARNAGHFSLFSVTPNERFIKFLGEPYEVIDEVKQDDEEYKVVAWALN